MSPQPSKLLFSAVLIHLLSLTANAATPKPDSLPALKIGDKVPDFELDIRNKGKTRLSELKGKIVILDFWATWCTSCINNFPHLDAIQKQHEDQLEILLVNQDDPPKNESKVESFATRYKKKFPNFGLPIVMNDTIADAYFPHRRIPHVAWIDQDGIFRGTTSSDEVSAAAIEKLLKGETVAFKIKEDFMNFQPDKPLFLHGNGGTERGMLYKSIITGMIEGIPGGQYTDMDKNKITSRLFMRNVPIIAMYQRAYNVNFPQSHIVFNIADKDRFNNTYSDPKWFVKNTYCYELTTRPVPIDVIRKYMQQDLVRNFGVSAKIETRPTRCLILKKLTGSGSDARFSYSPIPDADEILSTEDLVHRMNIYMDVPVFNGLDLKRPIYIDFNAADIIDAKKRATLLRKNGLQLVEETRLIKLFILSDDD